MIDAAVRGQLLAMSASTIDRALRNARTAGHSKKRRRVVPEIRRRIPVRTFGDWNDPPPGSMEMDLVAHCGDSARGSFLHTLVLTDIGSPWRPSVKDAGARIVRINGWIKSYAMREGFQAPPPRRAALYRSTAPECCGGKKLF